ncbi:MAG: UPF0271 protein [Flavobacteriales bacterium]|jgi:UPF0271 protein
MFQIDINSDVGEGVGIEALLMPYLSSCNIACGGHAGDLETIEKVIALAMKHHVKIGAHPSYPDRANFGRKVLTIDASDLKLSLKEQILRVSAFAKAQQTSLHHVKPHGALYNKAAADAVTAKAIIETIEEIDDRLCLFVPYNSVIADLAKGRLRTMVEGFADRNYNEDYSLVSRSEKDALLTDPEKVWKHILPMITEHKLRTITGKEVSFQIDTLCVHGDTISAIEIVQHVHSQCVRHEISMV